MAVAILVLLAVDICLKLVQIFDIGGVQKIPPKPTILPMPKVKPPRDSKATPLEKKNKG